MSTSPHARPGFPRQIFMLVRTVLTGISLASSLVEPVSTFLFLILECPNSAADIRSFNHRTVSSPY